MRAARARVRPKPDLDTDDRQGLLALMNLGPATLGYLAELGVTSVATLARQDADELYVRLQAQRHAPFDPCLHDTFAAVIHEARTGEKRPWFTFTAERKRREAKGAFGLHRRDLKP